ncbi:MAG: DUF1566 domain-containing protein [Granulosicoccaceae bacterium]
MYAASLRPLAAALLLGALPCAADERFVPSADRSTVDDRQTGLRWQRDGSGKATDLKAAKHYCTHLRLGGHNNWRLPEVKELISLVDEAHYKPSAFPVFITVSNLYWSNTVNPKRPGLTWTVNFSDGHVHAFRQALDFSVRCVSDPAPS